MNPITQGLALGYSAQKLIGFLSKAFPALAPKIKQAQRNGHSVEQVLGFLSKTMETEHPKGTSQQEILAATNKNKEMLTKHGLTLAASAVAAPLAANAARSALSRALPHALAPQAEALTNASNTGVHASSVPPQISQSPTMTPPIEQQLPNTSQQPPVNQVQNNITQPSNIKQPEEKTSILENLWSDLDKNTKKSTGFESDAFLKIARRMKSTGEIRSKEEFERFFQLFDAKKKEGKELPTALKEASLEYDNQKLNSEVDKSYQNDTNIIPDQSTEQSKEVKNPIKIEKNNIVSSPNGIGEVKEVRNGQAIIDVDGKLYKVKEEDLQGEPEEVKKAKIEFNLDDVPEDLRSAPLNEVYAPAHRKHVTIKYNSDIGKDKSKRYIFFKKDGSPVDENIIENLRKGSQLPMTSGKTFWGGWSADTQDSRGTVAYHELTKLAQKEGEEDDPSKPYWFEEEEEVFTHGYSKMTEKKLKEEEKKFNEANKKPKKKRA